MVPLEDVHRRSIIALRVPETITPYVTERAALRVLESGHLGCRPRGTLSDQGSDHDEHRRGRVATSAQPLTRYFNSNPLLRQQPVFFHELGVIIGEENLVRVEMDLPSETKALLIREGD